MALRRASQPYGKARLGGLGWGYQKFKEFQYGKANTARNKHYIL